MNDNETKTDPLAAALVKVLECDSVCTEGYYHDSLRRLFIALNAVDHAYRDTVDRPHSVSGLRAELERRAVDLHRDHQIMVSILDEAGTVEDDHAEEVSVSWAARSNA
jgi:hypothetical protein